MTCVVWLIHILYVLRWFLTKPLQGEELRIPVPLSDHEGACARQGLELAPLPSWCLAVHTVVRHTNRQHLGGEVVCGILFKRLPGASAGKGFTVSLGRTPIKTARKTFSGEVCKWNSKWMPQSSACTKSLCRLLGIQPYSMDTILKRGYKVLGNFWSDWHSTFWSVDYIFFLQAAKLHLNTNPSEQLDFFHTTWKQASQLALLCGKLHVLQINPSWVAATLLSGRFSLVCTENLEAIVLSTHALFFSRVFLPSAGAGNTDIHPACFLCAEFLYVEWLTRDQGTLWRYLFIASAQIFHSLPAHSIHFQQ